MLRLILLSFFLVTVQTAFAQQRLFTNQQHFSVEDGLPQSFISGILQDEDGFIWLSTLDGFCRYDGRGFKTIRYNPKDSSGLAANTIQSLGRLVNNTITIYYGPTQADDFDLRSFKIKRNTSRDKLDKIPNILWHTYHVGFNTANWFFMMKDDKGAGWLNSNTGKIHYASIANGLLQHDTISAIVESEEGKIYLVSETGVHVSDTAQKKFEWIAFNTQVKKEKPANQVDIFGEKFSIVCLPGNRLLVDENGKIILIDISKKTSSVLKIPPPPSPAAATGYSGLKVDSKGLAYFENYGRIFRIDEFGAVKLLWENSIKTLPVSAFFIDRSDVLWVSVDAQGLLKIDLHALHFQSYQYNRNFICDIMEQAGVKPPDIPAHWTHTEASYFFRQARDSKGNLYTCSNWFGQDAIYQLNQQGFRFFSNVPDATVYGALLVMPGDKVRAYDQLGHAWYSWNTAASVPEKFLLNKVSDSMQNIQLADARFIGGNTWLSTYNHGLLQYDGLKRINRFAGKLSNGIKPETLTEIIADPVDKNKFWIGSR